MISRTRGNMPTRLAREWNGVALPWHELPAAVRAADVILSSTGAPPRGADARAGRSGHRPTWGRSPASDRGHRRPARRGAGGGVRAGDRALRRHRRPPAPRRGQPGNPRPRGPRRGAYRGGRAGPVRRVASRLDAAARPHRDARARRGDPSARAGSCPPPSGPRGPRGDSRTGRGVFPHARQPAARRAEPPAAGSPSDPSRAETFGAVTRELFGLDGRDGPDGLDQDDASAEVA